MSDQQQPTPLPQPIHELDLHNIQGDILSGLPKKTEMFYFIEITNPELFRKHMVEFIPHVKTVAGVLEDRKAIDEHKAHPDRDSNGNKPHLIPLVGVNISFSHFGLAKLGIEDSNLADEAFSVGQRADAAKLGDKGTGTNSDFVPDWDPAFKDHQIHAVILVAGESHATVNRALAEIEDIFGVGSSPSIKEIIRIAGDVRPGELSAHEHFGFLDGVSNPAISNFPPSFSGPGPKPIRAGAILLGKEGDQNQSTREPWMVDGSFLVFRWLFQRVPEFDKFLEDNAEKAISMEGLNSEDKRELLGARLVGRWKSGAPTDLTPFQDDPDLAEDPNMVNNFHFTAEESFQKLCPFAAHIRKTLPRKDLEAQLGDGILESRRIMRRGIQFGPEVTKREKKEKKTKHGRGLLFVCYQSSIENGFQFIQESWANTPTFPPFEQAPEVPGFDPIIGQGPNRKISGLDPNDPTKELDLPVDPWVVPRGGEYFFSPSIKGLKEKFVAA